MVIEFFGWIKKIVFGLFIFLVVLNVVKFEVYMLLNPSVLLEQTSEDTLFSSINYKLTVCKAKGLNPLKEIGKVLHLITLCPVYDIKTSSDTDLLTATYHFPLDPNPDSGQMNTHLRI